MKLAQSLLSIRSRGLDIVLACYNLVSWPLLPLSKHNAGQSGIKTSQGKFVFK